MVPAGRETSSNPVREETFKTGLAELLRNVGLNDAGYGLDVFSHAAVIVVSVHCVGRGNTRRLGSPSCGASLAGLMASPRCAFDHWLGGRPKRPGGSRWQPSPRGRDGASAESTVVDGPGSCDRTGGRTSADAIGGRRPAERPVTTRA